MSAQTQNQNPENSMKKTLALLCLCLSTTLPAQAQHEAHHNAALHAAINGSHRAEANRARDVHRHPYETLTFFGIEPDDTVIESWPGEGWYTEILAPYLKDSGKFIGATFNRTDNPPAAYMRDRVVAYDAMLAGNPEIYGKVEVVQQVTEEQSRIAEPGTIDAILDFRNAHNWIPAGADNIIRSWYDALKPGGIVGIVDHRRDADEPFQPGTGYIHEQQLIDLMTSHGFELQARSEINANPRDTKDHPGGVWNLPPTLRNVAEADRARYLAIGESDRMTLKFVKPGGN